MNISILDAILYRIFINISNIGGDDAYKIKVTEGSDVSYKYYSVASGYLVSVESEDENKNMSQSMSNLMCSQNTLEFRPVRS